MSFVSLKYIIFVFCSVVLYYLFPKNKKWLVLFLTSFIFYYLSSKFLFIFVLLSSISIYFAGRFIHSKNINLKEENADKIKLKNQKKIIMLLTVIFNFLILLVLKYSGFFISNLNLGLVLFNLSKLNVIKFVLPIGISYYTLMAVSYVVDVYRGKIVPESNILKLSLYLLFFPQIIEGPISKFNDVAHQYYEDHKFDVDNIISGLSMMLIGFFKKLVIADRAGIYVNAAFDQNAVGFSMFFAGVLYTLQIYAEFSGCMDIVIGTAKLFGINLPENFKRPFFSKNIQEFWRRWHITLGAWIKDYVFYPLSLSKANMKIGKFFKQRNLKFLSKFVTVAFPLLFVWLYNGFWHGASWKYVAYGVYYYLLIMVGILLTPIFSKLIEKLKINIKSKSFELFQVLRTSTLVAFGMLLFRSTSFMKFLINMKNIFTKVSFNILDYDLTKIDFILLLIYVVILIIVGIFEEKGVEVHKKLLASNLAIKYIVYFIIIMAIIILGIYGEGYDSSSFIYGQF